MRKEKVHAMAGLGDLAEMTEDQVIGNKSTRKSQENLETMRKLAAKRQMNKKLLDSEVKNLAPVEDMFKDKNITFEDIHKLHYNQFNKVENKNDRVFNPKDILDLDDRDSDDEILQKFRKGTRKSPLQSKKMRNLEASPRRSQEGAGKKHKQDPYGLNIKPAKMRGDYVGQMGQSNSTIQINGSSRERSGFT